jgi:hypothetical protein
MWDSSKTAAAAATKTYATSLQLELRYLRCVMHGPQFSPNFSVKNTKMQLELRVSQHQ